MRYLVYDIRQSSMSDAGWIGRGASVKVGERSVGGGAGSGVR